MKFRPLHDQVVVYRKEAEEITSGGVIVPQTLLDKPQEGIVAACGKGSRDKSGKIIGIAVKPGQKIVFGKHAGHPIKVDGENAIIMKESDVIGILTPLE